jgi:hypothetical protein
MIISLCTYVCASEWVSHNSVATVLCEIAAEEKVFISETKCILWEAQAETQEICENWEHKAPQHKQTTAPRQIKLSLGFL